MTSTAATDNASPRQPTVREMPTGERPRERLVEYGSKHLSNTELVAILLRTGSAGENVISLSSRLLTRFGGLAGLGKAALAELCGEKGLSEAKACQLLAALELGRRFVSLAPEERLIISTPQDAANLVAGEMGTLDQEHLRVILLNTRNEVLSTHEVYVGNVNSAVVRPGGDIQAGGTEQRPFFDCGPQPSFREPPRPAATTSQSPRTWWCWASKSWTT